MSAPFGDLSRDQVGKRIDLEVGKFFDRDKLGQGLPCCLLVLLLDADLHQHEPRREVVGVAKQRLSEALAGGFGLVGRNLDLGQTTPVARGRRELGRPLKKLGRGHRVGCELGV